MRQVLSIFILAAFLLNSFGVMPVRAQSVLPAGEEFRLPAPGAMVGLSPDFNPPILKGIKVHPDNPFRFDFILDKGDAPVIPVKAGIQDQEQLKQEADRLIKYFLAFLTIPEKDLWVNLSPFEKDRIVPEDIEESQATLGWRFGISQQTVNHILPQYNIKTITRGTRKPDQTKAFRQWAEDHRNQKVGITLVELSKQFEISESRVRQILNEREYGIQTKGKRDNAMTTGNGGIDLTSANMNLQTQNSNGEIKFHLDSAMLKQLQNAPGFVAEIIRIQPLGDLRQFLSAR